MKIDTIVEDMYRVVQGKGGWNGMLGSHMGTAISLLANSSFSKPQEPRRYLSLSSLGSNCARKTWYRINSDEHQEEHDGPTLLKFFYGHMLEELVLSIVDASGHSLTGQQDRLDCYGVKGHRDCVIDGMTVDVKTASPYTFKKFQDGKLREDDPFGYLSQMGSYIAAAKDDPLVTNKTHGAFLVLNKVSGELCLDVHDMTEAVANKEAEIKAAQKMVAGPMPTERLAPVPQSKDSPNTKLCLSCNFCSHSKECWPEGRTFRYSFGDVTLIDVVNKPRVEEVTDHAQ